MYLTKLEAIGAIAGEAKRDRKTHAGASRIAAAVVALDLNEVDKRGVFQLSGYCRVDGSAVPYVNGTGNYATTPGRVLWTMPPAESTS